MKYIISIILLAFALLTLFLSSSVIFDLFGIRQMEGNYVLFVVWSNWISSVIYLITIFAFFNNYRWAHIPLWCSVGILIAAQIGLYFHIQTGGLYEQKTVGAMIFRIVVTVVFAFLIKRTLSKINN